MAQEVKHHLGKKTQRHFTTKYFRPFWAYADIAQSVVHRLGKAEVTGSSPVISSINQKSLNPSKIKGFSDFYLQVFYQNFSTKII